MIRKNENARYNVISVRVDNKEMSMLESVCRERSTTASALLRGALATVLASNRAGEARARRS